MFAPGNFNESQPSTSVDWSQTCHHFEFPEILSATDDFNESLVIGRGGFGKVYKGTFFNGSVDAAIKRLDSMSNQGAAEFWAEVKMLSSLRHCHLVSLIGYCNYKKEMILIYEYMPNGTLEDHLHKLHTPLRWIQRLKICIGAARGLDYLHTGTGIETGVIHRDVKSSNILLHESWAAKISDFGLSKIGPKNQPSTYVNTGVKGTFGYIDPNYFLTGKLTRKSDVYAFGVVLLEVLCRKRAVDKSIDEEQWGLASWAQESIKEGKLKHIIDYDIRDQISSKCLKEFVLIAEKCLQSNPKHRPTMAEVIFSLESALFLEEKTNDPLQPTGKTIIGRMLGMFPFTANSVKTGPSITDALGRIARSTKALTEGGYEKIFLSTFETVPDEKLLKYYACYYCLSTSAGPVMGMLYMSNAKLAFCSDNPLPYNVDEETLWSYYKVVIPLYQLKAVNASKSKANPAEKYIQIISVDNHEFWFMDFVNYDSAVKHLQGALQSHYQSV